MKWLTRPEPGEVGRQVLIFAWILMCNLAVQLLHGALSAVGMPTWPIFLSNILYFLMGAPEYKERLIHCVCGGVFGLVCAVGLLWADGALLSLGLSSLWALMLPLAVALFLLLALHPVVPWLCNNVAFAFFTISLLDPPALMAGLGQHILGVLLGNAIINVGVLLLAVWYGKRQAAKAKR